MRFHSLLDSSCGRSPLPLDRRGALAFTLIEVLVAMGLFFLAIFAILDATTQGLRAARSLERNVPDVGLVVAEILVGKRPDLDGDQGGFDAPYESFQWAWRRTEIGTNGLFEVVCSIEGDVEGRPYHSSTTLRLWRPDWSRRTLGPRP